MQKRLLDGMGTGWRVTVLILALALLTAAAWMVAAVAGPDTSAGPGEEQLLPAPERPEGPPPAAEEPAAGDGEREVPRIEDPVEFARVFTELLWSYDTRTTALAERTRELKAWMTGEAEYADWASVASQLPTREVWERLADSRQRASAEIEGARFPAAFTAQVDEDPGVLTEAYLFAVTVTGTQTIEWSGGGRGAEERAVTLAVQCRPAEPCALSGRLPRVAP
ncbi:hypothetical protein [Streptomyces carpaticus]|uniref:hypothetical protein n=1 Tax=Streptomyces carpaticus TaxID=285558 RepID=UPI0031F77038